MPFTKLISTALNLGLADSHCQEKPRVCIPSAATRRKEHVMYMLKNQALSSNGKPEIKVGRKELEVLSRLKIKTWSVSSPALSISVSLSFPHSIPHPINMDRLSVSYMPSTRCSGQGLPPYSPKPGRPSHLRIWVWNGRRRERVAFRFRAHDV